MVCSSKTGEAATGGVAGTPTAAAATVGLAGITTSGIGLKASWNKQKILIIH